MDALIDIIGEAVLGMAVEKANPRCFNSCGIVVGTSALIVGLSTIVLSLLIGEDKLGYERYWNRIGCGGVIVLFGAIFAWVFILTPLLKQWVKKQNDGGKMEGKYPQAISDYTRAIELDLNDADAYYNRGNAYYDSGNLEQAIENYNKAIELDPSYTDAYYNRGNAYSDTGNLEQAIENFERYIEHAPNAPDREEVMDAIRDLKSKLAP